MKNNVRKPSRDLHWRDSIWLLFQRFFEQSAMKIIIYCVIDQPSLAQSWSLGWRSVLNFKFSFLAFLRLMTCPMNIAQKMCKKKIFQLQSMSKKKLCVDNCFAVKNSSASWLISSIPKMKSSKQKSVQVCKLQWSIYCFFKQINEPMASNSNFKVSQVRWIWIQQGAEILWLFSA